MKKVNETDKFPLVWSLVQKVGASKNKGKFRYVGIIQVNIDNLPLLFGILHPLRGKWTHPDAQFSKLKSISTLIT